MKLREISRSLDTAFVLWSLNAPVTCIKLVCDLVLIFEFLTETFLMTLSCKLDEPWSSDRGEKCDNLFQLKTSCILSVSLWLASLCLVLRFFCDMRTAVCII